MSKVGTTILALAVLSIGILVLYLAFFAASQPFAVHMAMIAAACGGFLIFIARRSRADFDQPQS